MAAPPQIARIEERRRLLLARSEQYRQQLAVEIENLRTTAVWVERGYFTFKKLRNIWPVAVTVAGFLIARKRRAVVQTGSSLFRNATKLLSWWRIGRDSGSGRCAR